MTPNTIHFYKQKEVPYGVFGNFPFFEIEIDGVKWNSTEIYFQAKKFAGTEHEELVRAAETSKIAAEMGRDRSRPLRADWDSDIDVSTIPDWEQLAPLWEKFVGRPMRVKDYVMFVAVRAKFTQHILLQDLLLGTDNATLVEHTEKDSYWGDGGDGSGQNMLGKTLMILRELLSA